jgi:hypothetical protein
MLHCSLLSLGCAFGFSPPEEAAQLTALRALKIAQRRLRPEVRARLLGVSSSKTDPSLKPEAWRFVFFDAGTSGKCRVVTVAAHTSSEHPDTVEAFSAEKYETASGLPTVVQNKWTVDSDAALEQIRRESKLKGVKSAQYRLEQPRTGKEATWVIEFFDTPGETLARFQVGARTGDAYHLDLHAHAA